MAQSWDVLVMAYGTPRTLEEVEPYYTHIRRGRSPSPQQLQDLVRRYEAIGGVSPLNEITEKQVRAVEKALRQREWDGRIYVGMKHWHPFIAEAVEQMAKDGVQRAVGVVLAPHYSRLSIGGYVDYALQARERFSPQMELRFVERWGNHPLFVEAVARRIHEAMEGWHPEQTMVVFSAHSLPTRIRQWNDPYERELLESAQLVAQKLNLPYWTFAYQSASSTGEPWLGPDILERLEEIASERLQKQVLCCAIGFVADHLEVLYDLDVEARQKCEALGLQYRRAASLNDDPLMAEAVADVVIQKMG
ncbi:MAG: ferrochelatase [Armatimonadota bacterium]|nr:MAG: ferrochelatase [Armatimonadota bacterium]